MTINDDVPITGQRRGLLRQCAERNEPGAWKAGVRVLVRLADIDEQRRRSLEELREFPGLDLR